MDDEAFSEFAAKYVLIPGQRLSISDSLNNIGFDFTLPETLHDLLLAADQLGHQGLVLTETDPLLVQWNPFSGVTPLLTDYALGVAGFGDHRWLQSIQQSSVKVIYHQIHEAVHALWAAFGLCGGLSLISSRERHSFHALAEACAVYLGDIEAPELLAEAELFEELWPAGAHRSHAIAFTAPQALAASGLVGEERAEWLFSVYLDGHRALPQLPSRRGQRAEALAFLIEETSYAEKIDLFTTPQWLKHYWDRPEIKAFIHDFIPKVPPNAQMTLADGQEISSLSELRSAWREITFGKGWVSQQNLPTLRAQLHLRRVALKVCEMIGVFSVLSSPTRCSSG